MDHQLVAVCQACIALSAVTGLDFHRSNIENFNDVMPVLAGLKRKSEERLNTAIHRLEEEEDTEVRLLDAAICRLEEHRGEAVRCSNTPKEADTEDDCSHAEDCGCEISFGSCSGSRYRRA